MKRPSAALSLSLVIAAYFYVRLIPRDFGGLAYGYFPTASEKEVFRQSFMIHQHFDFHGIVVCFIGQGDFGSRYYGHNSENSFELKALLDLNILTEIKKHSICQNL